MDDLLYLVTILFVLALVGGLLYGLVLIVHNSYVGQCEDFARSSGLIAEYREGACWVQLCGDLEVRSSDFERYFRLVESCE